MVLLLGDMFRLLALLLIPAAIDARSELDQTISSRQPGERTAGDVAFIHTNMDDNWRSFRENSVIKITCHMYTGRAVLSKRPRIRWVFTDGAVPPPVFSEVENSHPDGMHSSIIVYTKAQASQHAGSYRCHLMQARIVLLRSDPVHLTQQVSLFSRAAPRSHYVGRIGQPLKFRCASHRELHGVHCMARKVSADNRSSFALPCLGNSTATEQEFFIAVLTEDYVGQWSCFLTPWQFGPPPPPQTEKVVFDIGIAGRQEATDGTSMAVLLTNVDNNGRVFGDNSAVNVTCHLFSPRLNRTAHSRIRWLFNGKIYRHNLIPGLSSRQKSTHADGMMSSTLFFSKANASNAGSYQCQLKQGQGNILLQSNEIQLALQGSMSARNLSFFKTTSTGNTTTTYTLKVAVSGADTYKYCANLPTAPKYCSGWTFPRTEVQILEGIGNFTLDHSWTPALKPNCEGLATWVMTAPTALASAVEYHGKVKLILKGVHQEQGDSTRPRRISNIYRFGKLQERGHEDVALSHTLRCL